MSPPTAPTRHVGATLLAALAIAAAPSAAPAAPVTTFDFDALAHNANNTAVRNYLQQLLTANGYTGTVTVTGAGGGNRYDGEGYVVGPVGPNGVISPVTLGTSEGGVLHTRTNDNFLVNTGSDRITMVFSEPIYSAAFDFEIFPNGTVPDGTRPGVSFPDFTFNAFAGSQQVTSHHVVSVMPGTNGTFPHSPNSGPGRLERAPQWLGSAAFHFPTGVTKLEFIDWPERIGIDNLKLGGALQAQVPEPATALILAAGLGGLGLVRRRRAG